MCHIDEEKTQRTEYLIKYSEMLWNYNIHTEKLAHEVFYVIIAMTIGIWTVTNQFFTDNIQQILMYCITLFLAIFGIFLMSKFQHSNDEIRIIMNKTRLFTEIQDLKVPIDGKDEKIFPEAWEKYEFKDVRFCRKGLNPTGSFSWWDAYKIFLLFFSVVSIVLIVQTVHT